MRRVASIRESAEMTTHRKRQQTGERFVIGRRNHRASSWLKHAVDLPDEQAWVFKMLDDFKRRHDREAFALKWKWAVQIGFYELKTTRRTTLCMVITVAPREIGDAPISQACQEIPASATQVEDRA